MTNDQQFSFQPAKKYGSFLRLALAGPSGSGKTFTALEVATGMARRTGGRVAVIDTEHGSALLYADLFEFDHLELDDYDPRNYIKAIDAAEKAGYAVLIIDSLSHAWAGPGGALEQVDQIAKRSQSGNSFTAWRDVTPLQNRLIEALTGARLNLIATMRAKSEYVLVDKTINGRTVKEPKKVGLAPIQRDGVEYEFAIFGEMNLSHELVISKSRVADLQDAIIDRPGPELGERLVDWLAGEVAPERPKARRPVAPDDVREIVELFTELKALDRTECTKQVRMLRGAYPHAAQGSGFTSARLWADEADEVRDILRAAIAAVSAVSADDGDDEAAADDAAEDRARGEAEAAAMASEAAAAAAASEVAAVIEGALI